MFRYLFEHWAWSRIDLAELREDSLNLPYIAPTVELLGGTTVTTLGTVCPYIAPAADWESYYAGRSRKLRADVRRRRKKLAALGRIRFSRIRSATEDLWPTLDALRAVNRIHYGARRLLNLDKHEAKIRCIRSLVAFLSETGYRRYRQSLVRRAIDRLQPRIPMPRHRQLLEHGLRSSARRAFARQAPSGRADRKHLP